MKQLFRESLIKRRNSLTNDDVKERSITIIRKIQKLPIYQNAHNIGIYYPIKNEVNLLPLLEDTNKQFFFPFTSKKTMNFVKYSSLENMVKDETGVYAPSTNIQPNVLDLLIVPCVGFNKERARLGFGKGFYDRFIKNTKIKIKKIIMVAYSFQAVNFKTESHDLVAHKVVTDVSLYKRSAVILAAGEGSRTSKGYKCLTKINNKFLYEYSLDAFDSSFQKIVVLPLKKYLDSALRTDVIFLIGSQTRQLSMTNAIPYLDSKFTYIHDGARPYLSSKLVNTLKAYETKYNVFYLAKQPVDTIRVNMKPVDRNNVLISQTPQVIKTNLLKEMNSNCSTFTDDVTLIETQFDIKPIPIVHTELNDKITYDSDLINFKKHHTNLLIGHSFDIHPLVSGRPLILGGISLPSDKGLDGVSDGDCLLHAIAEAIFGALQMGDLGIHFPPSNPQNNGISSIQIIKYAQNTLIKYNKYINNIDCLIYYEGLKLKPYYEKIKQNLIILLQIDKINIKSTTTEKIGPIGENEAIGCEAVVLLGDK